MSFLSIPRSDIERLAVSPFQWIRYVMFTICGARGDLSTTPNGPAVDYETTEIANDENTYYYRPSVRCAFVDYEGLNDRITTTEGTARRRDFRDDVARRDGPACVVTQVGEVACDVAHLIPHSKGDEYIERMMQLRSPEDGSAPRIDMTENGILLSANVHRLLSIGQVAFIKTPNYELRPEHIKRFRRGDERQAYITLQWIKKLEYYDPTTLAALQTLQPGGVCPSLALATGANVDALFRGEGVPLPSTVILDYLYGIAAYKAWRSKRGDDLNQMKAYRNEHYAQIPKPSRPRERYTPTRSGLEETMDELNMVLMYIHGITPEMAAERRQKEIEREERAAQEASRSKVRVEESSGISLELYSMSSTL
ncbi:hypothetical protein BJV74DRAFT_894942 [Russula compacta]|nr:hypothetical protein BJV74DRAFT_894942 [Russula compacta]